MDILTNDVFSPAWGIPLPVDWKKSSRKKVNKLRNMRTWNNVFNENITMALSRFQIDGLPDTGDARVFLMSDLWYGYTLIFKHKGSIYTLPCVNSGAGWTVYGYWKKANWVALNGFSDEVTVLVPGGTEFTEKVPSGDAPVFTEDIGVVIRSSPTCYPFITQVMQATDYMADTLRTLDTARRHLKHPTVIAASQSALKSVAGQELEIDDNQDIITLSQMADPSQVQVLNLGVNGITDEIKELYEWYKSDFAGKCGIRHNSQSDKKGENLLTDEVNIDEERDNAMIRVELEQKQHDLEFCNKMLGTNIRISSPYYDENEEKEDAGDDDLQLSGTDEDTERIH